MLVSQICACALLLLTSTLIAVLPLILLRWFYRRRRKRLRELRQRGGPKKSVQGQRSSRFLCCFPGSSYGNSKEDEATSGLEVPSVILDLGRSLDGGLLLATLFLILIPQLRVTFDHLMQAHIYRSKLRLPRPEAITSAFNHTTVTPEPISTGSTSNTSALPARLAPIPLVEVILCLAFFALYFFEEFAQVCFRYRKYFWACNSSLVYSSSKGKCDDYTALDYRLNCTKRFLIDCSRKTFSDSPTSGCSTRSTPVESSTSSSASSSSELSAKPQTEVKIISNNNHNNSSGPTGNLVHEEPEDSLQYESNLFQVPGTSGGGLGGDGQNESLSATSSIHLPSYYWQLPVSSPDDSPTLTHCHHHHHHNFAPNHAHLHLNPHSNHAHHPQQMPYSEEELANKNELKPHPLVQHHHYHHHHQHQPKPPQPYCCCHAHLLPHPPTGISLERRSTISSSTTLNSSGSPPGNGVFTKIFLTYTTLASSTPALYIGEGLVIASQPNPPMLWLVLAVILVHKLVTGLMVSFELYERTTGRQRHLPGCTISLFTLCPTLGFVIVLALHHARARFAWSDSIEWAAFKVILAALSAATLLHLVLLVIQRTLVQFQPQFQIRKPPKPLVKVATPQHSLQQNPQPSFHGSKAPTLNSFNSKSSLSTTTALSELDRATKESPVNNVNHYPSGGDSNSNSDEAIRISPDQSPPTQRIAFDPEIVTNPPRFGVLHHFTMYTGFIIVLMAIAMLNIQSFKV